MKRNDCQLGRPEIIYKATMDEIEAITTPEIGMMAYATDIEKIGIYTSNGWKWDLGGSGSTEIDILMIQVFS